MEKILFIIPPHVDFEDFIHPQHNVRFVHKKNGIFGSVLTEMPLGVLSMSAYIKKHADVEVKLLDFNIVLNEADSFEFHSFADFFKDILARQEYSDFSPTIIGVSALFTPSYKSMLDIAKCCRMFFSKSIIVAGGSVPTNMYGEILKISVCFDALCYGEGEKPLLNLVQAEDKLGYLNTCSSWITQTKVEQKELFQYDFIENLDEIPFYDYGICEIESYGKNPAISAYASIEEQAGNFHVMTSRGCTHHCCFCSSHKVHGRYMRYYSVDRVREDFKRLKEEYRAETLVFQDDHLMGDKQRVFEIIDIIKGLDIRVVFQNSLALYALDRKMLEALKSAGVNQLLLSVESGSNRVLKEIMHKPLNLSIIKRVVDDCRDLDIYTNVNILIGLPGETKKDIEDTRAFLRTIDANWFLIFCANPLIGSEMFDICLEKKYLKGNYIGSDYKRAVVETEDFTVEYIQDMAYILNLEFNFVRNSDFRLGNYTMALKGFENAIKAKNDHAIAYYYAAKCYEKLGNLEKTQQYMNTVKTIASESSFWKKYIEMFTIPVD